MASLFETIAAHETPHEFVKSCLNYEQGNIEAEDCWDRYNETWFWHGLDRKDDFDEIIDIMVEELRGEFA